MSKVAGWLNGTGKGKRTRAIFLQGHGGIDLILIFLNPYGAAKSPITQTLAYREHMASIRAFWLSRRGQIQYCRWRSGMVIWFGSRGTRHLLCTGRHWCSFCLELI